ncbi:glycosyltransferase family 61 protein [Acetobacter sp. AN02]|uniref:glycosyltransferase family 61 protein n=1 Tax=Acetobacter sp. AN02 TaxID=2894186 RepID=UPI0024345FC1|nr:glycosyltransferase family 61 protein [Acetobacter sp. AN02]MDG6093888.1 glycosyltransferase family 61 protein [Acetobacter sp. AN02]
MNSRRTGPATRISELPVKAITEHRTFPIVMPPQVSLSPVSRSALQAAGIQDMPPPDPNGALAHLFTFTDATIATRCGVVMLSGGQILTDTLDHRHPDDQITVEGFRVSLPAGRPLPGCWLSLLLGGCNNLFHFALMNAGRLALLKEKDIRSIRGILIPADIPAAFSTLMERAITAVWGAWDHPLPEILSVSSAASFRPDRLILPWNVAETGYFLPQALTLLSSLAPHDSRLPQHTYPRRLYISRSDSPSRPLRNEAELVFQLKQKGFVATTLSGVPLDVQAGLFANADMIVAPHGAGLTGLIFAKPGTRVIELMPDRLMNWCYRRLAAMLDLHYDIVTGPSSPEAPAGISPWYISPEQVVAMTGL